MIKFQADSVWSLAFNLTDAVFDDNVADEHASVMEVRVVMRCICSVRRLDMDVERHGHMRVQISLDGCRLNRFHAVPSNGNDDPRHASRATRYDCVASFLR